MAGRAARLWPEPLAWEIDETSFPKAGEHSVGVAHQYCGALGKLANCQVGVTLHYTGQSRGATAHVGSAALGWRLFLPRAWAEDPARRLQAHVPESVGYRTKNELALELVREAQGRGLPAAPVLADSDYGDDYGFRASLRALGCAYGVAVQGRAKAWTQAPPEFAPRQRRAPGQPALPTPRSLEQIARGLPARAYRTLTLRQGTKGALRGRFARVPIWAAHGYTQRQHRQERAREWLLIEWPKAASAPVKYWLLWLGVKERTAAAATPAPGLQTLALLAKRRWQVEQDYRELKEELGLDHFEGRHWLGWHHHVTLAALAHLFLGAERQRLVEAAAGKRTQKKSGSGPCPSRRPAVPAEPAPDPPQPSGAAHPPARPLPLVPRPLPSSVPGYLVNT